MPLTTQRGSAVRCSPHTQHILAPVGATVVASVVAAVLAQASLAQSCGDPQSGDCCLPNASPACSDASCCSIICAFDTFCCDVAWDATCAAQAAAFCELCGGAYCAGFPTCQGKTFYEKEFCGDINGGCDSPGEPVESIVLGDVVCARYWADEGTRDTDWYEFTQLETTGIEITVSGELPTALALVESSCPDPNVLESAQTPQGECAFTLAVDCLPPGTYRLVVEPVGSLGFACAHGGFTYSFSLASTTGCGCLGDIDGDGETGAKDLATLLGGWGVPGPTDINVDGTTDATDLGILLGCWSTTG